MWQVATIPAFADNYLWLLQGSGRRAAVVDPGDAHPVLEALDAGRWELAAILITHHHADHVGGVARLLASFPEARVYGPEDQRIGDLTRVVREGDHVELDFLPARFAVFEVPGHTRTHVAYYSAGTRRGEERLFCGDTIFACGCGRLFEGTPAQMCDSLSKLRRLPETTQIYCAHEYTLDNIAFAKWVEPGSEALLAREREARALREAGRPTVPSRLATERRTNPFLRFDEPQVVAAARRHAGAALSTDAAVFGEIRRWKDTEFD